MVAGVITDVELQILIWEHGLQQLLKRTTNLWKDLIVTIVETHSTPMEVSKTIVKTLIFQKNVVACRVVSEFMISSWGFPSSICKSTYEESTVNDSEVYHDHHAEKAHKCFLKFCKDNGNLKYTRYNVTSEHMSKHSIDYVAHYLCLDNQESKLILDSPFKLIVDIGNVSTKVVPTYDSVIIEPTIFKNMNGGLALFSEFREVVNYRSANIHSFDFVIYDIMKKCIRVSLNYVTENNMLCDERREMINKKHSFIPKDMKNLFIYNLQTMSTEYDDKTAMTNVVILGPECITLGEQLFNPRVKTSHNNLRTNNNLRELGLCLANTAFDSSLNKNNSVIEPAQGLVEMIIQCIKALPPLLQQEMARNICLKGGLVDSPGLIERLLIELRSLLPSYWPIQIIVPTKSNYATLM